MRSIKRETRAGLGDHRLLLRIHIRWRCIARGYLFEGISMRWPLLKNRQLCHSMSLLLPRSDLRPVQISRADEILARCRIFVGMSCDSIAGVPQDYCSFVVFSMRGACEIFTTFPRRCQVAVTNLEILLTRRFLSDSQGS
jgi:hypothetical protein